MNNAGAKEKEFTLEDIFLKVKQNIIVIILIFVVVLGLGVVVTKVAITPYYEGTCIMSIENQTISANTATVANELIDRLSTQTKYESFLQSVKDQASDLYGANRTINYLRQSVSVKKASAATLFSVVYRDSDPRIARDICNLMSEEIKLRVNEEFTEEQGPGYSSWAYQYTLVKIENAATLPASPAGPNTILNIFISFIIAIFLALAYVVLKSILNTRFSSSVEVQELTGLDVITKILRFKEDKKNEQSKKYEFIVKDFPDSINAERYRKIPLKLAGSIDKNSSIVQITSTIQGEFKTTTATNLALALNEYENKKILIIDMDLRRPKMHDVFNLKNEKGLSDYIMGDAKINEIIKKSPEGIDVIPSGKKTQLSHVLVSSPKVKELLDELRKIYDVVILDSPPVLSITDAVIISKYANETLFVINQKRAHKKEVLEALKTLKDENVNIAGIVMNNVTFDKNDRSYSYE